MAAADGRVDEQIAEAPSFAQPVMRHLRALVHRAIPDVEETIKWGRPFFMVNGRMVCFVAAFKQHCTFGFVGPAMRAVLRGEGMATDEAGGSVGRIVSITDLPEDARLLGWLRQAAATAGEDRPKRVRTAKSEAEIPEELAAALRKSKEAQKAFASFSPSCRREYVEWIEEAKRAETRERRVAQAVTWIAEGKTRNWKYENC